MSTVSGLGTGAIAGEQLRQSLRKLTKEWQKVMGADEYELEIGFAPENTENGGETTVDQSYLSAKINYNLGHFLENSELPELVKTVVHELAHVITAPFIEEVGRLQEKLEQSGVRLDEADRKVAVIAQEQSTTRIERAIWRVANLSPSQRKRLGLPE